MSKMISADYINATNEFVHIKSTNLPSTIWDEGPFMNWESPFIVVDEWDLGDFDIITDKYPLVPRRFFDLISEHNQEEDNDRMKIVHTYSNTMCCLFDQNPLLIDEELGLYMEDSSLGRVKKNNVYNFHNKRANIHPIEFGHHSSAKEIHFIYAFISPHELTEDEQSKLSTIEKKHSQYVRGVKTGWSILITGMDVNNAIIKAGVVARDELVALLSEEFWDTYHDYKFKFTDQTIITRK